MAVQCRICGAPHINCGPVSTAVPLALDNVARKGPYTMADLKNYTYVLNGVTVTAKLTADDAKLLNAKEVKTGTATSTSTASTSTSAATDHVEVKARPDVHTAARTVPNKGR